MSDRVKCFVICLALLVSALGFCSCRWNGGNAGEEPELMHIIITYPNSSEIYVDGYGTAKNFVKNDCVRVKIDGKTYWTQISNVLIVDGE